MEKIKETKFNLLKKNKIKNSSLLNYQNFLKNNYLKKNKYKLSNHLFENNILLKKNELNLIELNQNKNIFIPNFNQNNNFSMIYTIQTQYENHLLFDYKFNYNLLYNYNKILLEKNIKEKNNMIKARIIGGKKKGRRILIAILGLIFTIKPKQLHKNKRIFYGSKLKFTKNILFYKLKYLNFKIDMNSKNKSILSRKKYVQEINEKNKKKYATI
jgi:hypothetical protein